MIAEHETLAAPGRPVASAWTDIYFDPGRAFESLRERPRFLAAAVVIAISTLVYNYFLVQHIGLEKIVRAQIEASPRSAAIEPAQKEQVIQSQLTPQMRSLSFLLQILWMATFFAGGAGLYLLGSILMVSRIGYRQALSVWVYSSLPPTLLMIMANTVMLLITPQAEIDPVRAAGHSGLVYANPSLWIDATAHPVMATAAGALDLFAGYALFLAALGLRKVAGTSASAAWGIVGAIWMMGVLLRIGMAAMMGTAIG